MFVQYYEIGLMSNFDHLSKQLTGLVSFLTQKNMGPESLFKKLNTKDRLLNQYASVLNKVVHMLS